MNKFENTENKNILYSKENILENNNPIKTSNKKIENTLKKISAQFFLKKYENIVTKKGKLTNKKKSISTLLNYSENNSLINLHHKLDSRIHNNLNITDRALFSNSNHIINLKKLVGITDKNLKMLKQRPNNKKLMIECGYFSNKEKYDISGDKCHKKNKAYISSLNNSSIKYNNTNTNIKNEKIILNASSKPPYTNINIPITSKIKNNNNKKINNTKRILDNIYGNINFPRTAKTSQHDTIFSKIYSSQRFNSDLSSLEADINFGNNYRYYKMNKLKKDNNNNKGHEKLFLKKDNILKSIKVNKNNCLEKGDKNYFYNNNNKINKKIYSYINTNNTNNYKKNNKNKKRLLSCQLNNEQLHQLQKEIITESNYRYKRVSEKAFRKNQNLKKINQSSSTKEKNNITFFANYIKNNNMFINNNIKANHFYTNSNISSYINNNSEIIRTNTNSNFNMNTKNANTSKRKKEKSLLYKKAMINEEDFLKRIKMKLKSKASTTFNSKDNSKSNILYEDFLNNSLKNTKNTFTSNCFNNNININNKGNKGDKKIFINNIINVENSNSHENENMNINMETSNRYINNNDSNKNSYSYRFLGGEKIKSFKNQIIGISSKCVGLDYSFTNQSQRIPYQNKIPKNKLQLRDIILNNKNKNDNKLKNIKTNVIKKNNLIKYQKIKPKKLKINKEFLLNKDKKKLSSIQEKYESSEIILNPPSKHISTLSNIFPELNNQKIIENLESNDDNNNNSNNENKSIASTMKECEYYKQECQKLSSYIINYFTKNNSYPNTSINFYKYGRLLGKGAFGKVNIALHLASGRLVAIKSFNKKKLTTRRAKRKIKTEIEALSKLRNPFCTQIYDYFETENHILIVMEYVCGDLLSFMRKRSKISEPTAKIIFKQIVKGLQYIHKKKIVHRDIKLDNILIDLTNTIKICDFGVSRILEPGDVMYEHCGTPAYIAPEIFRNEGYEGYSCDVWSAGVTLYYMLAGSQPFKGGKIEEVKESILKGVYDPVEDISSEASDLIEKMLNLDPNKRITVDEILKHPWLKKVDVKNRQNLKIFTNAEKGLLSKYDVNYLSSPKEELIEIFTISNLETKDQEEQKGATKSDILAPYNSYSKIPDEDVYDELKIENDICKFNFKAQLSNIKYELSNNLEFDNGIIKTMYNSAEREKRENKNKNITDMTQSLNLSLDSVETFTCGLCDDVIKDIEELIGYDKKYLVQCLRKNEINYATATYYLMLKEELNSNY